MLRIHDVMLEAIGTMRPACSRRPRSSRAQAVLQIDANADRKSRGSRLYRVKGSDEAEAESLHGHAALWGVSGANAPRVGGLDEGRSVPRAAVKQNRGAAL